MAYLDRMGREGVRELVSDGDIATPEQMAERSARLEEQRRHNAPILRPVIVESNVANEAELRDALRGAIAERTAAEAAHSVAMTALTRGREVSDRAQANANTAAAEVDRIGADLAGRVARWAAGEANAPEPDDEGDDGAHGRHAAAQARATAARRAVEALTETEAAAKATLAAAATRVQQSVHRVVAREAEVIARRAEALRAEADALVAGIVQIGAHFGPNATVGAIHHTATARLAGGSIVSPRVVGSESAAQREMREAWGTFVQALASDADAQLILPDQASRQLCDLKRPVLPPTAT